MYLTNKLLYNRVNGGGIIIAISKCLLACNCRYNASHAYNKKIAKYLNNIDYITICPELLGGLKVPRDPAEIVGGSALDVLNNDAKILSINNEDQSDAFIKGAYKSLEIIKANKVDLVVLKEDSPSCGVTRVYDGSFRNKKINGMGLTSCLLNLNDIEVINEETFIERLGL